MPEFEKDFVLRQAKGLAEGLSQFLTQKSVDDIVYVNKEDAEGQQLSNMPNNVLNDYLEDKHVIQNK